MTAQQPEIRGLTAADDLEPLLDLGRRSFGAFGGAARQRRLADARESIAAGRHLGAFDGGRLLGAAKFFEMVQWWHGRSLPMAGVANGVVAPEARGQGVGKALMIALIAEMAELAGALGVVLTVSFFERAGRAYFNSLAVIDADARVLFEVQSVNGERLR